MCVCVDPSRTETETYVCTMNESLSSRKRVRFEIRATGVFVSVIGCCQRFVSDAAGVGSSFENCWDCCCDLFCFGLFLLRTVVVLVVVVGFAPSARKSCSTDCLIQLFVFVNFLVILRCIFFFDVYV